MTLFRIAFVLCLVTQGALASSSVCHLDAEGFQRRLSSTDNRMAFVNPPGKLRTGLCWWHSRFQRNATYLFEGSSSAISSRADSQTVSRAISAIIGQRGIVQVPGYANLYEFSAAHSKEIAEALFQWQLTDSAFKMGWMKGLQGSARGNATQMRTEVIGAHERIKRGQIVFQLLQVPGVVAHSWLAFESQPSGNGVRLSVVDSNMPTQTMNYSYTPGMSEFYGYLGDFSPITQREKELKKSVKTVIDECARRKVSSPLKGQLRTLFGG